MIVVSDTSPLTNLAAIGRFELLKHLFTTLNIPEAVIMELNDQADPGQVTLKPVRRHGLPDVMYKIPPW
jgi:predicted nucleic acid-binding protein